MKSSQSALFSGSDMVETDLYFVSGRVFIKLCGFSLVIS